MTQYDKKYILYSLQSIWIIGPYEILKLQPNYECDKILSVY